MRFINQLSYEKQSLLEKFYRHSKKHETRQKAQCILLSNKGITINELVLIYKVHLNTIYNWFNEWETRGLLSLYPIKGQGRKPLLSEDKREEIKKLLIENPKQIKKVIFDISEKYEINVSTRTLKRYIKKKLNFTWRRVRKSLKSKRPIDYEIKKKELEVYKKQNEEGLIDLYYADGSGFSLIPYIPYAWQERGETIEIPCFRSKTLNLFGIWDAKTDLNLYSIEGSLTSDVVIQYIDDFTKKITKKTIIVIDNAPIHKSNLFKNKLKEWKEKGLEIFHLPSYSPHLNLIEHLWRFMKYEWIEFSVYNSWDNLIKYIEKIVNNFGVLYTINFG